MWHQLAKNACVEEKMLLTVLCRECKRLQHHLEHQKCRSQVSPARQIARQQPSSSFKLKYLSPASVVKKNEATQMEKSADKAKLAKCDDLEVTLDDEQSDELSVLRQRLKKLVLMNWIRYYFKEADGVQLEILFMPCGSLTEITPRKDFLKINKPTVSVLVGICKLTVMLLHASGNGCRTNCWSLVTIRIGMFLYV